MRIIALFAIVLASGCGPRVYCQNETLAGTPHDLGVIERCQAKAQCRDRGTGRFVECPEDDAVTLGHMRETMHEVEQKAAKQREGESAILHIEAVRPTLSAECGRCLTQMEPNCSDLCK